MTHRIPGTALPHHDLQLRRGGRLARMEWSDEAEAHVEIFVHPDEFPAFLDATACIADEVSLRDIMVLIEKRRDLFADMAACGCIPDLLAEMRGETEKEGVDDLPVALEMGWSAIVVDGMFQFSPLFIGRTADGEPVDLAFAPLSWIADLPVMLDETFIVVDDDEPEEAVFASRRMMTLLDVVRGILDELTQLGNPEEKQQAVDELKAAIRGIENGEEAGYTAEEVMEHAALQAEEARKRFPCRVCGEDSRCACFGKPRGLCHDCFVNMKES